MKKNNQIRCFTTVGLKPYPGDSSGGNELLTSGDLFQGAINCSTNPAYPPADKNMWWRVSAAGHIGGAGGKIVEVGDQIVCIEDNVGGTEGTVGTSWMVFEKNITPSTLTILRTGTSIIDYVTPDVLADQFNGGVACFSAAQGLILSGHTANEIAGTISTAANMLQVGFTANTHGNIINLSGTVDGTSNIINGTITPSEALDATEKLYGVNFTMNGFAANVAGANIVGVNTDVAAVSTDNANMSGFLADISSIRDTDYTDACYTSKFTGTLNNARAIWYGLLVNAHTSGTIPYAYTHTDGDWNGIYISNSGIAIAGNIYGGQIYVDSTDQNNHKYGLTISKNLTNSTAVGPVSQMNPALSIYQISESSGGASGATTIGNSSIIFNQTNTADKATADQYTGKLLELQYVVQTTTVGTATNSATGLDLSYKLYETAGTLTMNSFDVSKVSLITNGTPLFNAGTYNILEITGTNSGTVPVYGATSYVNGLNIDISNLDVTDGNLVLSGLNIVMPNVYGIAREYAASFAGDARIMTVLTDTAHIRTEQTMVVDMPVTSPGQGFDAAGGVRYIPYGKRGVNGMILQEIYIDLKTALVRSVNTLNDIIGEAAGGAAYIGQITNALNGNIVVMEVMCVETPATGDTDIDFSCATAATGAYNDDVSALAGYTALVTSGGAWSAGTIKIATTVPNADTYIYLSSGNGGTAGAYSAGKFIIKIYGV